VDGAGGSEDEGFWVPWSGGVGGGWGRAGDRGAMRFGGICGCDGAGDGGEPSEGESCGRTVLRRGGDRLADCGVLGGFGGEGGSTLQKNRLLFECGGGSEALREERPGVRIIGRGRGRSGCFGRFPKVGRN
jgi:hypothetical protein